MNHLFRGEPLDIVKYKYSKLSENSLRNLCTKYNIRLYYDNTKKDLVFKIIPHNIQNVEFLKTFYHKLQRQQRDIVKYLVNYDGRDASKVIRKVFNFDILLIKGSLEVYVWWLELFMYENKMDEDIQLYFQEFLSDKKNHSRIQKNIINKNIIATTKDISSLKINKYTINGKTILQKLTEFKTKDIVSNIRILYTIAKDKKIVSTLKGTLAVRSEKLLAEKLSIENYIWIINFLINLDYLTAKKEKIPTKAFDTLIGCDDGELIKRIFNKIIIIKNQEELKYVIFQTSLTSGKYIKEFRKLIVENIKKQNTNEWINIDYIVDQIDINTKNLKLITNNTKYTYGFYPNNKKYISYNNLEYLKVVIRYFIKSFIGILYRVGICSIGETKNISYCKEDIKVLDGRYGSEFSKIEYFKLSDIGLYGFGIKEDFEVRSDYTLVLNPYSLDIKVDNDTELSRLFLEKMAKNIENNRYKTDIKLFMQNINSPIDYENIKKIFLSKVDFIPINWEKFFKIMDSRVDAVSTVSNSAVLVKIKKDKEILQLIASNERLKSKILKADSFHLVILKENLISVKKIFKEYGILI